MIPYDRAKIAAKVLKALQISSNNQAELKPK